MEYLSKRPTLYEILRYAPKIVFSLNCVSKEMQEHLSHDMDYMHYLLEESFGQSDVRSLDWIKSLELLSSLTTENAYCHYISLGSGIPLVSYNIM